MTYCQWKEWKELSGWKGSWPGGTTTDPNACFVSEYALNNAKEDWAESFELYFCDPETLKELCPKKYKFIHDIFP